MAPLDNRTILFIQIFVGIISTLYSFFPSTTSKKSLMQSFRLANLSFLFGFGLLTLQGLLPGAISIIASNTFIILGFLFFCVTASGLYGRKIHRNIQLGLPAIHLAGFLYFTLIMPNTFVRIVIVSLEVCFINLYTMLNLRTAKQKRIPPVFRMLQFSLGAYTLLSIFRIVITFFLHQKIESIFTSDLGTTIIFMGTIAFHLSMNLIFIITLNIRYDEDARFRIQLLEDTHQEITHLNSLHSSLASDEGIFQLYRGITQFIIHYFKPFAVAIYLKDPREDRLNLAYITGFPEKFKAQVEHFAIDNNTLTGKSVLKNRSLVMTMDEYPETALKSTLLEAGFTYLASYPIHTSRGTLGSFTMGFARDTDMLNSESALLHLLCHQLGTILENAKLYESLNTLASTDALTGILNRRELLLRCEQEYARAKRQAHSLSILMMDIDHFKKINDTYGHDTGDFVLKEIASIVDTNLRTEDIFGRYGGEEFLVILRELDINQAMETAERIRKKVEASQLNFRGDEIRVTVSFGMAEFSPLKGDRTSQDELITLADRALYRAKQTGRNRSVL